MEPSAADGSSGPIAGLLASYPAGVLLLRDSLAAAGHFLLPWIGAASLKQGHKVLVLSAAYSPAKHAAALRKIGVNTTSSSSTLGSSSSSSSSPVCFVSAAGCCTSSSEQPSQEPQLQRLYQQVAAAATQLLAAAPQQQQQQQQQLTVVVDSLACLSALSGGAGDQVSALVHHLMALGEVLQVAAYRLVLLAAHDIPDQHLLLAHVAARSHVVADVAPLEGRTAALDGSVTITIRRAPPPPACRQGVSSLPVAAAGAEGVGSSGAAVAGRAPGWLQAGARSVWFYRSGDVGVTWLSEVHGKELMA